jgi:hypothetical protein
LQRGFASFLQRSGASSLAREIVEGEQVEIALYEKYRNYYSYGFYIARNSSRV